MIKSLTPIFLVFQFFSVMNAAHDSYAFLENIMLASSQGSVGDRFFVDALKNFCSFSTKMIESHQFVEDGLRFFINTGKRVVGIKDSLVIDSIEALKNSLSSYMSPTLQSKYGNLYNGIDLYREGIKNHLVMGLSSQFDLFKKDPNLVLNQLAFELAAYYEEELSTERLRKVAISLVDVALNKIVWSLHDQEKTWESVKAIAYEIIDLVKVDIINNPADLDDCLWTLVERYALFIELVGIGLSEDFYTKIQADLERNDLVFLLVPEQNSCMYSKIERLKGVVLKVIQDKKCVVG